MPAKFESANNKIRVTDCSTPQTEKIVAEVGGKVVIIVKKGNATAVILDSWIKGDGYFGPEKTGWILCWKNDEFFMVEKVPTTGNIHVIMRLSKAAKFMLTDSGV